MLKTALAAVAVAALAGPAFAIDLLLPNGSFETASSVNAFGAITSWTTTSNPNSTVASGVFTSYAGFTPSNGSNMAVLTNSGSTVMQIVTSSPMQLLGQPFLNFNFAFLTTDATSTALASRDQFVVLINYFSDSGGTSQLGTTQSVTINTGNRFATGNTPGTPFNTNVNGASPLRTTAGPLGYYVVPINMTSAPYATFTFFLDNLGSGTGTSAVLLDQVYITPEPGTLALFGLGALGLGGIVLRRRRAKLAAAKSAA
jgi:hypothetical protein